jgi:hypothetical protein
MKKKIKIWIRRYFPAEVMGTLGAVALPTVLFLFTDSLVLLALAGTWGENGGFYGMMIGREVMQSKRQYKKENKRYGVKAFGKNIRNIVIEFGAGESLDSFIVRPAVMMVTLNLFSNMQLGILVGKIAADVIFYIPVIISYELRKKHLKD